MAKEKETSRTKEAKIKFCTCRSSYQDKLYGEHNRVHNERKGSDKNTLYWRCTVCGKET